MSGKTRTRGFSPWTPRVDTWRVIDAVQGVLREYADYLPLTLRQCFYRLVTADVIGKTETEYKRLGEILNRARRASLNDFDAIRDDGLVVESPPIYASADAVLARFEGHLDALQIDRQIGQERRLRIWCEASGMVPQLTRVAGEYSIPVLSSGGFDSTTAKHNIARELSALAYPVLILHLGDFDPSGEHVFSSLDEDIAAFAEHYGGDVEFQRLAVVQRQVDKYELPTAPPKDTDRRSFSGTATTQCEALDPATLAAILRAGIETSLDLDVYRQSLQHEAQTRERLREILGRTK